MNLHELYIKLKSIVHPEDLFGDSIDKTYKKLVVILHPDKYIILNEKTKAEEAFKLLGQLKELADNKVSAGTYGDKTTTDEIVIATKTKQYGLSKIVASGDICDIYAGEDKSSKVPYIFKVPRSAKNNDLLISESTNLKIVREKAPKDLLVHFPELINSFEIQSGPEKKRINLIVPLNNCFSLEQVIEKYPSGLDVRDAVWMYRRMLGALVASHSTNIVHGGLVPSNFMIEPDTHNGILIDWSYSVKVGEKIKAISPKYKELYPPEVFKKQPATLSIDTFMATMCFIKLVVGNEPIITNSWETKFPVKLKNFLKSALLSPAARVQDAWELHNETGNILKTIYGPAKFRLFSMK